MAVTINKKTTIQLLRNSQIYSSKAAAKSGLESAANIVDDGCPLVARYTNGSTIGALLGIKNTINNITKVVIFDNVDSVEDIQTIIEGLDLSQVGGTGKMITTISQSNGQVSATAVDAKASNIAYSGNSNTTVEGALNTLYNKSNITVTESTGSGNTLKSYTIAQNGTTLGTINIPTDMVVSSGEIIQGTWSGSTFTPSSSGAGKALKLTIANQTNPIYINVADLVDAYTAGNGINISNSNVVSVKIDSTSENFLSVGSGGVKLSGVQSAINSAVSDKLTNISVNSVNGTVSSGVASVTLKTNNIKLDTGVSSGTFSALTTSDTITAALGKLYGGIVANQTAITGVSVSNSDNSITVTSSNSGTDIKVNIVDCGTYTI